MQAYRDPGLRQSIATLFGHPSRRMLDSVLKEGVSAKLKTFLEEWVCDELGQAKSDAAFQKHWDIWFTAADLDEMLSYGINTIRIPLGYWLDESLVDKSEHFPKGAVTYLIRLCGWASDRGFYIILGHHGAPGAQERQNPFTGQYATTPGFYNDYQYDRGVKFLKFLRKLVHDHNEFRNVGMIEVLNEPVAWDRKVQSMRSVFYKDAYTRIRQVEKDLNVARNNYVHIQMMNTNWGSGNPVEFLSDTIAVPDNVESTDGWSPSKQKAFYKKWFAAQVYSYEKSTAGWVFWTWKTALGDDYRWSYKAAVAAGVITKDLNTIATSGVCG
ncbi:endo-beta-1,6-glucanase [Colletotrichum cuscutae]|uniref:glucan endo-1,6-beta-glucosidase n=1 Tax=Colletotrichum cuscutae TaxID=1209917 RepID=A0AAI9Y3Y9_9PEZI|nr:endo-beta-1,6-glucanase [Colletotrichum cuscutae]